MDRPHLAEQDLELYGLAELQLPRLGSYAQVLVTRSFPNSLVGELAI